MDDLISRQAAIDAIVNTPSEVQNKNIPLVNQYDGATFRQIEILGIIEALPSAQPEPTQEIQDILDYLDTVLHPIVSPEHWDVYSELHDMVSGLPSAQPEIIYCGECKHMMPNGKCRQFADSTIRPSASDFCSAGERKDNG